MSSWKPFFIPPTLFNAGWATHHHIRHFSENDRHSSSSSQSSAQEKKIQTNSLGSVKGGGLSEELLKKQTETTTQSDSGSRNTSENESSNTDEDAEKKKKEAEASWRAMKYSLIFMGVSLSGMAGYLVGTWGTILSIIYILCKFLSLEM